MIVDDQRVQIRQAGADQAGESLGRDARQFQVGAQPGGTGLLQHRHPAIGIVAPRRVHTLMDPGQAEMEGADGQSRKIEMVGGQQGRSAGVVQMRPAAGAAGAECIGVLGGGLPRHLQAGAADAELVGFGQQKPPVLVVADQPDGFHRHVRVEPAHIDGKIAAGAAAPLLDILDLDEAVLAGPVGEQLVAVDAPRPAGDEPPHHRGNLTRRRFSAPLR